MPYLNLTSLPGTSNAFFLNSSYTLANQPPFMTTMTVWLFFIAAGLIALYVSRSSKEPTCKDLFGVISTIFLLISAIQSFAVDRVTGIAMSSGADAPVIGVLVETHTVYHYDLIGVALAIVWIISVANLYLLWLDHTRVTNQEQIPIEGTAPERKGTRPRKNPRDDDEEDEN